MFNLAKAREGSGGHSVSVVLAIVALLAAMVAFNWLQQRNAPMPTTANLVVLSGAAVVTRADAGGGPPLETGAQAALQRGDEVRTGPGGKARLTFSGGETTELGENTRLSILELYQAPVSRALVTVLALHEGKSLTRIRHMLLSGMRFEIETSVATVAAHGTAFRCDAPAKGHLRVEVYEGAVQVAMGGQTATIAAGQGIEARFGQPLTSFPVSSPPLLEETDSPPPTPVGASPTATVLPQSPAAPASTPTPSGDGMVLYTVQEGDTLFSISRQHGVPWQVIWEANKDVLKKPELISPGQQLRIPRPR